MVFEYRNTSRSAILRSAGEYAHTGVFGCLATRPAAQPCPQLGNMPTQVSSILLLVRILISKCVLTLQHGTAICLWRAFDSIVIFFSAARRLRRISMQQYIRDLAAARVGFT